MLKFSLPFLMLASTSVAQADTKPHVKTIVLVHGAFADGSSWDKVTPLLEAKGYRVIATHHPLSSLEADVVAVKRAIEIAPGPVLLVGHSWGGFVITEAGNNDKVTGLVYVGAFAPDTGESITSMFKDKPAPEWVKTAVIDSAGFAWLPRETVATLFAQDLPAAEINLVTAKQGPLAMKAFDDKLSKAAWRTKPSWFIRTEQDRMIPAEAQSMMAKRAGSKITSLKSSHVAMLSHPKDVAAVILQAAAGK